MPIVAAYLVPGSPLPYLRPDNPPWRALSAGYQAAARGIAAARPDVLLVYSTQWLAVLDELWQTRPRLTGVHVDENWYEFGDLAFDIRIDSDLANACVAGCKAIGISAKGVDYDGFPVDTGTIVANNILNARGTVPLVIAANNLYHDGAVTERLGAMAAQTAERADRKIAVLGVGGLSGTIFRDEIDVREDRIASDQDDAWNRTMLDLMRKGEVAGVREQSAEYARTAKVDMGFKHMYWILGAIGGRFYGANILGYGPVYGSGAAVVEFRL